jgi:hypothetical protein
MGNDGQFLADIANACIWKVQEKVNGVNAAILEEWMISPGTYTND